MELEFINALISDTLLCPIVGQFTVAIRGLALYVLYAVPDPDGYLYAGCRRVFV